MLNRSSVSKSIFIKLAKVVVKLPLTSETKILMRRDSDWNSKLILLVNLKTFDKNEKKIVLVECYATSKSF